MYCNMNHVDVECVRAFFIVKSTCYCIYYYLKRKSKPSLFNQQLTSFAFFVYLPFFLLLQKNASLSLNKIHEKIIEQRGRDHLWKEETHTCRTPHTISIPPLFRWPILHIFFGPSSLAVEMKMWNAYFICISLPKIPVNIITKQDSK